MRRLAGQTVSGDNSKDRTPPDLDVNSATGHCGRRRIIRLKLTEAPGLYFLWPDSAEGNKKFSGHCRMYLYSVRYAHHGSADAQSRIVFCNCRSWPQVFKSQLDLEMRTTLTALRLTV